MKETVNVSIASQAFTLDKDAYELLSSYLGEIRARIAPDDNETVGDIEARFAEIFREKLPSNMMVVSIADVRAAIALLGTPDDFGEPRTDARTDGQQGTAGEYPHKRLYRSRNDRLLAGVCGGLAEYFGIDVQLLRLAMLILMLLGGLSIWVYIILWIIIPEATETSTKKTEWR